MAQKQNATQTIFRWIAVLPGSLLAMLLSMFPLRWFLYINLTSSGFIVPYPELPERLLGPLVATLTFVWAGSRIAPSRKVEIAVLLFGTSLLISGVAIALGLNGARVGSQQFYLQLSGVPLVFGIFGALIGLYIVRRENC
jgi:hypothetical protein